MLQIQQVSRHRNGVAGNGFYAVLFRCDPNGELHEEAGPLFVASVFAERGNVSVLRVGDMLGPDGVTFALNSWRGDVFEDALRDACRSWEAARMVAYGWAETRAEALAKLADEEREQEAQDVPVPAPVNRPRSRRRK